MFYHSASLAPMMSSTFSAQAPISAPTVTSTTQAPSPMPWLHALNPYQQALILPLLQQMVQMNSTPQMHPITIDEQTINPLSVFGATSQLFAQAKQRSPNMLNDTFHATDSTQENSPNLAFYNPMNSLNDCFSPKDSFAYNSLNINSKNAFSISKPSIHHPAQQQLLNTTVDTTSKKAKKVAMKQANTNQATAATSSALKSTAANALTSLGLDDKDDKNIIHINFTKNLLKSFKRYCEYFHKQNHAMLEAIRQDFDSNHMNNQLLVHFMTSTITMDAFKQFVNGPAQKWVKEQSRLKKQDQQLELIEICRQRLFEKIKVKKYSDSANPTSIDENNTAPQGESLPESQCTGQAPSAPTESKSNLISRKRPILSALQSHKNNQPSTTAAAAEDFSESASSYSSSSSSDSFDQNAEEKSAAKESLAPAGSLPSKRLCRGDEKMVVLHEEVDAKVEEFGQQIKIEDSSDDDEDEEEN